MSAQAPRIRHSARRFTQSRTATDEARTAGRLISAASGHLARYANVIAPGSMAGPSGHTMPSGERLVSEAESRGSKAEAFIRRHVKKADGTEENMQNAENAVTAGVRHLFPAGKEWAQQYDDFYHCTQARHAVRATTVGASGHLRHHGRRGSRGGVKGAVEPHQEES